MESSPDSRRNGARHERCARHRACGATQLCVAANRWGRRGWCGVRGDQPLENGVFWYAVVEMIVLVRGVEKANGSRPASQCMAATGIVTAAAALKRSTGAAARINGAHTLVRCLEFSFPSATLHAVSSLSLLGIIRCLHGVIPFSASVLYSRVVSSVHYPSDVFAATRSTAIASVSLAGAGTTLLS